MARNQLPPQIRKIEVIDRRTGKPVVRYQVTADAGIDPFTGKRQQVRRRYGTEKQARDASSEISQQAATDPFVPRKAVTVGELCVDRLASLRNAHATTLNAYRYALAPLRERYGDLPVQKPTRPDLDRLLTDLALRAADKDRSGHLWYQAQSCWGEIAGLRWSDVDLGAGTLTVTRNRVQAGAGKVVEGDPKTLSSRRALPLDDGLVNVLRRASARYAEERLALGANHADSGYVAVNEAGEPYTPDTLTRMWHKLIKIAGVRPIRLHDARTHSAHQVNRSLPVTCGVCRWR